MSSGNLEESPSGTVPDNVLQDQPRFDQELSSLDEMSKEQLVSIVAAVFKGPLPHPEIMEGYEKVLPGSADRILAIYESEVQHRHESENKHIAASSRDSLLGILAALIIAIVILACGTSIIIKLPGLAGAISGSLLNLFGVATIVNSFLGKADKNEKKNE